MKQQNSIESHPARRDAAATQHPQYSKWRAATLLLVYALMVVHVLHWKLAGKTLAPLELNEVMYTFELGIVTAGFVFMVAAVVSAAIFGRFFCSWGCHILALQDLCAWILGKLRIRPKGVRSRLMLWIPVGAAFYMFVWPQVIRVVYGHPLPRLHLASDREGWASFLTENFWRNLPGPVIALLTFGVCGFLIVYVLGSRAFCTYGCPYGAIFGLMDRIAPGRIRVRSADACKSCGACTAACSSHVRVHEEINRYGMVVDSKCLKDLDCVAVCPNHALRFGFGRPAILAAVKNPTPVRKTYDFTFWEDGVMMIVFLAVLFIFRGLYDRVPFLMTIGLGAIVGYAFLVLLRIVYRPTARFNRWPLKNAGSMLAGGYVFTGVMLAFLAFAGHSALIQYHAFQARRHYQSIHAAGAADHSQIAQKHLDFVDRWSFLPTESLDVIRADLYAVQQRWPEAERHWNVVLGRAPTHLQARIGLAASLLHQGKQDQARREYARALELDPSRADVHYSLAGLLFGAGERDQARGCLERAVELRPDFSEAHYDLGAFLIEAGDMPKGIDHLRRAVELRPDFADGHYNLAVALTMMGRYEEASSEVDRAFALQPKDPQTGRLRAYLASIHPPEGPPKGD